MISQSSSGSDRRLIVQLLCESNYSGYSTVADALRCYCIKISTDLLQDNCSESCEVCGYRPRFVNRTYRDYFQVEPGCS